MASMKNSIFPSPSKKAIPFIRPPHPDRHLSKLPSSVHEEGSGVVSHFLAAPRQQITAKPCISSAPARHIINAKRCISSAGRAAYNPRRATQAPRGEISYFLAFGGHTEPSLCVFANRHLCYFALILGH